MPTDLELMQIHARALFTHNAESQIVFVNEPGGTPVPAPRLFLGRTREGNVWRFRTDVSEKVAAQLNGLCADEPLVAGETNQPPRHLDEFVRLLESDAPIEKMWGGPAYQFADYKVPPQNVLTVVTAENAEMLQDGFKDLMPDVSVEQPFVAIIRENRAVSVCRSVRITAQAHEAGLETLPAFRGKGLAAEVTAEWAQRVRAIGAIPLYSTSWENKASQAVARKLRLRCYGSDFEII
jgi:RimJ/RimL family protein N-acetyltransferase